MPGTPAAAPVNEDGATHFPEDPSMQTKNVRPSPLTSRTVMSGAAALGGLSLSTRRARPLAVSTAIRWPLLPDLPTIAEAGVPGYEAASWFTLAAPSKPSKEIIGRLNASVDKFFKTEDGVARLRKIGAEPAGGSPEDMQAYVVAETEKWGKVAKFAGIKPE